MYSKTYKSQTLDPRWGLEAKQNGVSVGEMQRKLLLKVEELTLYVIELKKENETLKQKVHALEQKNIQHQ